MNRPVFAVAVMLALVHADAVVAQDSGADVDPGKRLYAQNCARCHGFNMVSSGAGFFDLRRFPLDDKPRFVNSVMNGVRAMPAWRDKLSDDDIESLWHYVASHQSKRAQ